MILDDLRFKQLEDGRTEVKFKCCDCGIWMDLPASYTTNTAIFRTSYRCRKCADRALEEAKRKQQELKESMHWWTRFLS